MVLRDRERPRERTSTGRKPRSLQGVDIQGRHGVGDGRHHPLAGPIRSHDRHLRDAGLAFVVRETAVVPHHGEEWRDWVKRGADFAKGRAAGVGEDEPGVSGAGGLCPHLSVVDEG